ncbi:hypothetical protein [Streptomyces sp. 142MFCol3.1]|uniref:hypothetical protein n=1 Tax=Streptomyces sp. 142MFCol3.1 TaxID=1172179 RepID=UPI00048F6D82|nr:hypothetical protein [Streptomyces sp. 142MFCol3.1]
MLVLLILLGGEIKLRTGSRCCRKTRSWDATSAELLDDTSASDVPARRFRGKNKGKRWTRGKDTELAVVRLSLDVSRREARHRVERLFAAMWSVKRAPQRDARDVVDAYWAGDVRRAVDAKAWRAGLGLSRDDS